MEITEPPADCPLCPRLVAHRQAMRAAHPDWFNAPVPSFGAMDGRLAIVGLAPGEKGANRTGRPFTGDAAGSLLWDTLAELGIGADDMLLTNAVACLPPGNKPDVTEIHACRDFLKARLRAMPNLSTVVALGAIAHQSCVKALGGKLPKHPFAHGAVHRLHTGYALIDSYHPSRLNQNSGRLTPEMFRAALAEALAQISSASRA